MPLTPIWIAAPLLLVLLLICEWRESLAGKLTVKPLLSALFVLTAVAVATGVTTYTAVVVTGLIFCLAGDVCLAFPQRTLFRFGLVAFLLGHLAYIAAFAAAARPNWGLWIAAAAALPVSTLVFYRLQAYLGGMKMAVMAYIVVITVMVIAAGGLFGDIQLALSGRFLVLNGAFSFYLSDIFVARQRFVQPSFGNRLIGLPLYYLGQFQIAFSTGLIG
ncbi:MAG TPA: lysoplasmalogenase [Desulfosarcina sp.]|nr:lysoplasmalogenase [Desulfosarcina sp.]